MYVCVCARVCVCVCVRVCEGALHICIDIIQFILNQAADKKKLVLLLPGNIAVKILQFCRLVILAVYNKYVETRKCIQILDKRYVYVERRKSKSLNQGIKLKLSEETDAQTTVSSSLGIGYDAQATVSSTLSIE